VLDADNDRLFALLEQRDEMLRDLAEQLVVLRLERPTADNAAFAATARSLDAADALIADVCVALDRSERTTVELAARVAQRAEAIRAELESVQRAGSAHLGYGGARAPQLVDSRR
jgi:hypothetical protein